MTERPKSSTTQANTFTEHYAFKHEFISVIQTVRFQTTHKTKPHRFVIQESVESYSSSKTLHWFYWERKSLTFSFCGWSTLRVHIMSLTQVKQQGFSPRQKNWSVLNSSTTSAEDSLRELPILNSSLPLDPGALCPWSEDSSLHPELVEWADWHPSRCRSPFLRCGQTVHHQIPCQHTQKMHNKVWFNK